MAGKTIAQQVAELRAIMQQKHGEIAECLAKVHDLQMKCRHSFRKVPAPTPRIELEKCTQCGVERARFKKK